MTHSNRILILLFLAMCLLPIERATAQFSGSRGGISRGFDAPQAASGLPELAPDVVQGYIIIEGQAELRVKPTEIRIVLAVTSEAKTPAECKRLVSEKIGALKAAWKKTGIADEDIVEDFIAVLPRYEFEIQRIREREVAVEKKAGYLMQINLHLAVKNDAQATSAIGIAFDNDVADIIAFDYWSKDLDQLKVKVRAAAVKAALDKSKILLEALFKKRPLVINVQEATRTHYPKSLYVSFTNSSDMEYLSSRSRRDIPQIRTFRPKNTYYRGLYMDADVQSKELPMRSEISVVSTVRLYFESPAAKEHRLSKKDTN
ncbi:MAG: SIMPL domain-containing protein [Planctomycetes bacterium]|nr:SIMPL domain-containing protein [Planctomycetota bacterium]